MERERRPLLHRPVQEVRLNLRTKLGLSAVLATETLERVAFYGVVGNLVIFLNMKPLEWMSYNAASTLFIFTGMSYLSSIFGGWLADSHLGKFKAIILFMTVYLVGFFFFPALAWNDSNKTITPPHWCYANDLKNTSYTGNVSATMTPAVVKDEGLWQERCSWAVFLSLLIMAIGNGGVKSNIAPFGADQVRQFGPVMTRSFFNWFYWCINIGALLALGVLAFVQMELSFKWGYIVPNICLALALLIFIIGYKCYVRKPAGGSVLTNVCKVVCEGCRRSRSAYSRLNNNPIVDNADPVLEEQYGCLDGAKVRYGGSFHDNMVDDVKTLGKLLLVFLSLVPYWAVYFQMQTTYPIQALHMKLDFRNNGSASLAIHSKFNIAPAWLSLFDVAFLLILLPLFDSVIYPKLDKTGHAPSLRARIIIGMCFAAASVLVAGGLENYRLQVYWHNTGPHTYVNRTFFQYVGNTMYNAADISVLWQIPQYALIGISEVFASVACLELAYTSAPRSMVSLIMGLFWCSQGLGSFLGNGIIVASRQVFLFSADYGDINCILNSEKRDISWNATDDKTAVYYCHLDYYYFLLAGLQLIAIVLFIGITWKLEIGRNRPDTWKSGIGGRQPRSSAYDSLSSNRSPRSTMNDSGMVSNGSGFSSTANSPNPRANTNRSRNMVQPSASSSSGTSPSSGH